MHRSLQLRLLHGLAGDVETRLVVQDQAFIIIKAQIPEPSKIQISQPGVLDKYEKNVPQVVSLLKH
jgi:hypothetical protein